jgi:hypothetical protein
VDFAIVIVVQTVSQTETLDCNRRDAAGAAAAINTFMGFVMIHFAVFALPAPFSVELYQILLIFRCFILSNLPSHSTPTSLLMGQKQSPLRPPVPSTSNSAADLSPGLTSLEIS